MTILKKLFSGILCASLLAVSAPAKCSKKLGLALIAGGVVTAVVSHNYMTPKIKNAECKLTRNQEVYGRYLNNEFGIDVPFDIDGYKTDKKKLLVKENRKNRTLRKLKAARKESRKNNLKKNLEDAKTEFERAQEKLDEHEFVSVFVRKDNLGKHYYHYGRGVEDKHLSFAKGKLTKTLKNLKQAKKEVAGTRKRYFVGTVVYGLGLVGFGSWIMLKDKKIDFGGYGGYIKKTLSNCFVR